MKLLTLIVLALVMTVPSFAGVAKFSYKGAKKAGHYSVKALKFSKKVLL